MIFMSILYEDGLSLGKPYFKSHPDAILIAFWSLKASDVCVFQRRAM